MVPSSLDTICHQNTNEICWQICMEVKMYVPEIFHHFPACEKIWNWSRSLFLSSISVVSNVRTLEERKDGWSVVERYASKHGARGMCIRKRSWVMQKCILSSYSWKASKLQRVQEGTIENLSWNNLYVQLAVGERVKNWYSKKIPSTNNDQSCQHEILLFHLKAGHLQEEAKAILETSAMQRLECTEATYWEKTGENLLHCFATTERLLRRYGCHCNQRIISHSITNKPKKLTSQMLTRWNHFQK